MSEMHGVLCDYIWVGRLLWGRFASALDQASSMHGSAFSRQQTWVEKERAWQPLGGYSHGGTLEWQLGWPAASGGAVCSMRPSISRPGAMQETTLVHHTFGGYLRNQVACLSCGHVSKSYESSLSLVLELPYRAPSLEAALQHFTKRERLDGDNKYRCDRWASGRRWCIRWVVSGVVLKGFDPGSSAMQRSVK